MRGKSVIELKYKIKSTVSNEISSALEKRKAAIASPFFGFQHLSVLPFYEKVRADPVEFLGVLSISFICLKGLRLSKSIVK
jgi:hypothetical protein